MTDEITAEVPRQFDVGADFLHAKPFGSGHINDTYLAVYNKGGAESCYIIQRINHNIFTNPPALMENIVRVTEHIRKKLQQQNADDIPRRVLTVIPSVNGDYFYKDAGGNYWRCLNYIANAMTVDTCRSLDLIYEAARAFGTFQKMLCDLPGPALHETIPNFHNSPLRFKAFESAVEKDICRRAKNVQKEIVFLFQNACIFDVLPKLVKQGEIPVRITHNDTKINNVMFDKHTNKALCVIDLDTVMPGLSLSDFGDIVRTTISDAEEDETDLSKVTIDIQRFEAIVKGYLSSAGSFLNKAEINNLLLGAKNIILEQAVRFLTDHLEGDLYYKTARQDQNLDRCRTQLKLFEKIIQHESQMEAILNKYKV